MLHSIDNLLEKASETLDFDQLLHLQHVSMSGQSEALKAFLLDYLSGIQKFGLTWTKKHYNMFYRAHFLQ